MRLQAPKGFKDYLPEEALKRKVVMDKIKGVFSKFGFDPLETPTLEYEETLTGKYGEEEKLIYKFETPGGDKVALKYDQTVPLTRVIAQYGPKGMQILPIPFKRYQIQSAYRGENTQKGRYREFTQCDADVVGINSSLVDAEILAVAYEIYQALGMEVLIKVNDRELLKDIEPKYLAALDKLNKIGMEGVITELVERGLTKEEAETLFARVDSCSPTNQLSETILMFEKMGYPKDALQFDPMLIRGLDYYTGIIMETVLKSSPTSSSLGGGGRYDKMIGSFTGTDLPAVGYSVGLDRTIEAMEEAGLVVAPKTQTKVLVTIFSSDLIDESLKVALRLRSENISVEIYLDSEAKLDKQLKYADTKGIPFAVVIGPDEVSSGNVVLKNLEQRSQETLSIEYLLKKLS
jgi:histidyl-tRNA synthetase